MVPFCDPTILAFHLLRRDPFLKIVPAEIVRSWLKWHVVIAMFAAHLGLDIANLSFDSVFQIPPNIRKSSCPVWKFIVSAALAAKESVLRVRVELVPGEFANDVHCSENGGT